jgi:hypothetical protein
MNHARDQTNPGWDQMSPAVDQMTRIEHRAGQRLYGDVILPYALRSTS